MTWINVLIWIVSYFVAKKSGASTGTAALLASGVTAAAHYSGATESIANWVGLGKADAPTQTISGAGKVQNIGSTSEPSQTALGTIGSVVSSAFDSASKTLSSWGPVGTAGVIGAVGVATSPSENVWRWVLIAGAVFLILRK